MYIVVCMYVCIHMYIEKYTHMCTSIHHISKKYDREIFSDLGNQSLWQIKFDA